MILVAVSTWIMAKEVAKRYCMKNRALWLENHGLDQLLGRLGSLSTDVSGCQSSMVVVEDGPFRVTLLAFKSSVHCSDLPAGTVVRLVDFHGNGVKVQQED